MCFASSRPVECKSNSLAHKHMPLVEDADGKLDSEGIQLGAGEPQPHPKSVKRLTFKLKQNQNELD